MRLNAEDYMMLVATVSLHVFPSQLIKRLTNEHKMFYTLSAVFNVKTSQAFNVGVYSTRGLNVLSLDKISAYAAGSK